MSTDPDTDDPAWVGREALVGFASYPLLIEDRLIGALAIYSRKPFTSAMTRDMGAVADSIALGIVRKQAEKQLRCAHTENVQLLSSISSVLISLDEYGTITKWNRAAEATFGISAAHAVGQPFVQCGIQWRDPSRAVRLVKMDNNSSEAAETELVFIDDKNTARFLQVTTSPIEKDDSQEVGMLLLGSDVTEQKHLQTQLAQAQKLESIGQLAAGIAHEISTPVQYIGDNVQFLKSAFSELQPLIEQYRVLCEASKAQAVPEALVTAIELSEERADLDYLRKHVPKAVEQALDGLYRVASIVRAMKEFSHPGSEKKSLTNINRCIESTITVTRNEWKYVADLEMDLDPTLPAIPCLPGEFNQVLVNLLVNAAHAIEEQLSRTKQSKGRIRVSTAERDGWMELRIQDSGAGIPPDIQHRVFDPFFTTKPIGKGTGQGLSLARNIIVGRHRGTIDFDSSAESGTTFMIRLPLEDLVEEASEADCETAYLVCR